MTLLRRYRFANINNEVMKAFSLLSSLSILTFSSSALSTQHVQVSNEEMVSITRGNSLKAAR
ncbi:MAG TPA: hypothetical protein V6D43_17775 [Candidatus Sericytochromatia bacterium]